MGVADGSVGIAFALVIVAGLCTTIGSTFAFCSDLANPKLLAGALGVSAGVMIYVSFGEIFMVKAVEGFEESGYSGDEALRYATFCFFSGMLCTLLTDKLVHTLLDRQDAPRSKDGTPAMGSGTAKAIGEVVKEEEEADVAPRAVTVEEGVKEGKEGAETSEEDKAELKRMGLLTAVAIFIHNFPEGLATFVAALADTSVGIAIAIAIALHNIPEGVCVAMPVFYATGSKWQGFWWSFLSGVSEPLGGLVGYLVLAANGMSDLTYGVLFAIVGGMMIYISLVELIPTALQYDPQNTVVTSGVMVGMAVMAASLLMFTV